MELGLDNLELFNTVGAPSSFKFEDIGHPKFQSFILITTDTSQLMQCK